MTRANFCKIKLCERKERELVELSLSLAVIGLRQIQMAGDICVENEQRVFLFLFHQQDAGRAGHCSQLVVGSNQQGLKSSRCQCLSTLSNPPQILLYSQETSPRGDVLHCWFPEQNWGSCLVEISNPLPAPSLLCSWFGESSITLHEIGRVQVGKQTSLCSGPSDPVLE